MPTLLEGREALATWLELSENEQKDYNADKKKKFESLMVTLEQFHSRKLLPGESLSVFVRELRKLLVHSMPEVESSVRDQLLLHQFISGLPISIAKQLSCGRRERSKTSTTPYNEHGYCYITRRA